MISLCPALTSVYLVLLVLSGATTAFAARPSKQQPPARTQAKTPHSPVEDCTPVDGLTTSFEPAEFNPFSLSQSSPGRASYAPQSPAAVHAGSAGALITILHSGRQASHIALRSVPTQLSHESLFSASVSVAASTAFSLELQLLRHGSAAPPLLSHSVQIAPSSNSNSSSFEVIRVTELRPASTGLYILSIGLGLAPANTLISLDDVVVCAEAANASVHLGRLLPESSTGFESWSELGFRGQMVSPADAAFSLRAPGPAAKTGSFGASVMIRTPGERPWHIQLAGPVVELSASHAHLVQLSLRATGPAAASAAALLAGTGTLEQVMDPETPAVQVSFVQDDTWLPTPVAKLHPLAPNARGRYKTYALPAVSVPRTGSYFLSIELGAMPAGSILHLDDIGVWEGSALSVA